MEATNEARVDQQASRDQANDDTNRNDYAAFQNKLGGMLRLAMEFKPDLESADTSSLED